MGLAGPGQELGHGGAQGHPVALGGGGLEQGPVEALVVGTDDQRPTQGPRGPVGQTGSHQRARGTQCRVHDQALELGLGPVEHGPVRPAQARQQRTTDELESPAGTVSVAHRGQPGESLHVGRHVVGQPEVAAAGKAGMAEPIDAEGAPGIGRSGVDRRGRYRPIGPQSQGPPGMGRPVPVQRQVEHQVAGGRPAKGCGASQDLDWTEDGDFDGALLHAGERSG